MSWREALAEHLAKHIGLDVSTVGSAALQLAVQHRLTARGLSDPATYVPLLTDENENAALIEELVIPESWFFRDAGAFARLQRFVAQERPAAAVRILCLPCAAGEEAYSIAMTLLAAGVPPRRINIDAVDLSTRAIAAARAGRYGPPSFRVPLPVANEGFFQGPPTDREVSADVRRLVHWRVGNILDSRLVDKSYDVIFCRNLLIYLTAAARRQVLEQLHHWLTPQGILFVGHSEVYIAHGTGFKADEDATSFALRPVPAVVEPPPCTVAREPAQRILKGPNLPPPRPTSEPVAVSVPRRPSPGLLTEAAARANEERYGEAQALCEAALRDQGPNAEAYFLLGMIASAQGQTSRAEQWLERAVYLDAQHDEALLALSLCAERQGKSELAQRYRQRAERAGQRRMQA